MAAVLSGKFILASASPRRIELLRLMGLQFDVFPSDVVEAFVEGEDPGSHVARLSLEKAQSVSKRFPEAWVMGADTIVTIDASILGKPRTPAEAREMLGKLSGRTHTVFTGFSIINRNENFLASNVIDSSVSFKNITEDEITWYTASEEPYDKAGGYAVQGMGAFFIREIHGSYTNVMGLPLSEAVDMLKEIGILTFS